MRRATLPLIAVFVMTIVFGMALWMADAAVAAGKAAVAPAGGCSTEMLVSTTAELNAALTCFNGQTDGAYTIALVDTILLTGTTTPISNTTNADLTISGAGDHALDGFTQHRGLTINAGKVTVEQLTIRNGDAAGGGGIRNSGTLTVSNSTLSDNSSDVLADGGGGIYNESGTVMVNSSTLSGNSGLGGGGIYNYSGVVTIRNSTLSGNSVDSSGGGIYNRFGTVTIRNSTLSENSSGSEGSGIFNAASGTVTVSNSVIAKSPSGVDCHGIEISSITNTLIEDGTCSVSNGMGGTNGIGNLIGDPKLASLADNGGATRTHALLSDSQAINAGDQSACLAAPIGGVDQRGFPRFDNQCDIGAYEAHTCAATHDSSNAANTVFSIDASAVQSATLAAVDGGSVKVAGTCVGVQSQPVAGGNIDVTLYITKSVTVTGGYPVSPTVNWGAMPDSDLYPTILDANDLGRVVVIEYLGSGADIAVTLKNLTLQNGSTADGTLSSRGGGLYVSANANVTVDNSIIKDNVAGSVGGGIASTGNLTVTNSTLDNNHALNGGGIYASSGTAAIYNSTLDLNLAIGGGTDGNGGGIFADGSSTLTISNSTLVRHRAQRGGAIYSNSENVLTVLDSTLDNNQAYNGGGVYVLSGTTAIHNSTLELNLATGGGDDGNGGGVFVDGSSKLTINNSTLVRNRAQRGGGVANAASTITMTNSTLSDNQAVHGGGVYNHSGAFTLINSIVANSGNGFDAAGSDCDSVGTTVSISYSLIEDGDCGAANGTDNITGDDPMLGELTNNGGATETLALLSGSQAIDMADSSHCPATDQRGVPRIGDCDMGAYEVDICDVSMTVGNTTEFNDAIACFNTQTSGQYSITFSADITLTKASTPISNTTSAELTISGVDTYTLNGDNSHRGLTIDAGNVTVDQLTIQNGRGSDGGGIRNAGTLTVSNSTLSGNSAQFGSSGGGIYNDEGSLTVNNSTVSGNKAGPSNGGGIFNNSGLVSVISSNVSTNTARFGGGIWNRGTLTVSHSTLSGNSAEFGGGINNGGSGEVTVNNSTLSGNSGGFADTPGFGEGGGIYNSDSGTVTVNNSTLENNSAIGGFGNAGSGGGIHHSSDGMMTISNSTLSSNTATGEYGNVNPSADGGDGQGGGIYHGGDGVLAVSNSTLSSNTATGGDGVDIDSGDGGDGQGGGIYHGGDGVLAVSNSTLSGNTASGGDGGSLRRSSGSFSIGFGDGKDGNGDGGAIFHTNSGSLTVNNSTLVGNSSSGVVGGDGSSIRNASSGMLTFTNSIVANSVVGTDCSGTITFANSLDSDDSCDAGTNGDNIEPADLGPLFDNGGATETHALLGDATTNPAINTGDNSTCEPLDQRGFPRVGACDIGAYEFAGVPTAVALSSQSSTSSDTHYLLMATALLLTGILLPLYRRQP